MVVVSDETCRLQAVYHRILFVKLPIERYSVLVAVPLAVEPDSSYLAVLGKKLSQLFVHEIVVCRPVLVVSVAPDNFLPRTSERVLVTCPIQVRIVKVQPYSLLVAFIGKFLYHVTPERSGIDNIVVALFGVPHGKTVVVTAGEAYILRSGILYGCNPCLGIETVRVESVGCLGVFSLVYRKVLQIPFALREHAVYAPVDENSEFAVGEFLSRLQVLRCRCVFDLLCRCNC